jgi:hypothetical protein
MVLLDSSATGVENIIEYHKQMNDVEIAVASSTVERRGGWIWRIGLEVVPLQFASE